FTSTGWQLAVLADLGVLSEDPRFANAVEHFFELHNVESGGFSLRPHGEEQFHPHVCNTGNMVRALAKAGYSKDDRVRKAMGWLLSKQLSDSAWNCAPSGKHGSDRKSTRLNSSHLVISYAVFCLLLLYPSSTLFPYTTLFRSSLYVPTVRNSSTPMFATLATWSGLSQKRDIRRMTELGRRWAGFSPSNYPIPPGTVLHQASTGQIGRAHV